jgi:hypothetical protein
MSSKREKLALKEIDFWYDQWINLGKASLLEILTQHLQINKNADKYFQKLALLREPLNSKEWMIDEYLLEGKSSADDELKKVIGNDNMLIDFHKCRELYYLTRSLVLAMIDDLIAQEKSNNSNLKEISEIVKNECIANEIFHDTFNDFIAETIQSRIANNEEELGTNTSKKKKRRTKNFTKESATTTSSEQITSKQAYFRQILLPAMYFRDLERSFAHITKGKPLSVSMLGEAFDLIGKPKPTDSELKVMIDDVRQGTDFNDVFDFISKHTL